MIAKFNNCIVPHHTNKEGESIKNMIRRVKSARMIIHSTRKSGQQDIRIFIINELGSENLKVKELR